MLILQLILLYSDPFHLGFLKVIDVLNCSLSPSLITVYIHSFQWKYVTEYYTYNG